MTEKRARYVAQVAAGMEPEAAAAQAGYGAAYARQVASNPETQRAIEARRAYLQQAKRPAAEPTGETPMEVLRAIAYDPLQDAKIRIQAIQAMERLERSGAELAAMKIAKRPIIIDDIPNVPICTDNG